MTSFQDHHCLPRPIVTWHGVRAGLVSREEAALQREVDRQCAQQQLVPPIFSAMSWAHHLDLSGALGEVDMIADVLRYEHHKAQIVAAMIREPDHHPNCEVRMSPERYEELMSYLYAAAFGEAPPPAEGEGVAVRLV